MAGLSTVTVNKGSGGIGRLPASQDYISGILFYNNTLPSSFGSSDRVKVVYSIDGAESLGITVATHAVEHYHIDEFFRANPTGKLWVGFYAIPAGAYDFAEVTTMNQTVENEIRQWAIYCANDEAHATALTTTLQGIIDALPGSAKEAIFLLHADMSGTAYGSLGDLRALNAPNVCNIAAEDGAGVGAALAVSEGYSISAIGAYLGHISRSPVNESAGYVAAHNFSDGVELETPALATGDLVRDLTTTALGGVKDDGYAVLRKHTPEVAGTYSERMPAAVPFTNDFAFIENMRVMNKAVRQVRASLIPELARPLLLNDDGTLSDETVEYFESLADKQLNNMLASGEISAKTVNIDPTQDILATDTLVISIQVIPTGTAEFITVNIKFTDEITT